MKDVKTRAVLIDDKPYQKNADGSLVPLKGKTDWKRLDRMTSKQVEDIAASDKVRCAHDGQGMGTGWNH